MPNPNAAKGQRWERAIRDYLKETHGRAVIRPRQEHADVGDIHLSPFVVQAKDEARHTFSSYVDDAEQQAGRAGEPYGVAVVKRRGKAASRAYVVMSLETFSRVVGDIRNPPATPGISRS